MKSNFFDLPNWERLFVPTVPILETFLRGTLVYLILFILLRFILKRESGSLGVTDFIVVVLMADASQNALSSDNYRSISDGILLVATIILWSHILNWLGFKFPFFQKIIKPTKLLLVKDGRMIRKNMEVELITEEELKSEMRTNGVADISHIARAYMEANGRISIICKDGKTASPSAQETSV